ncbi:MAG: esterase family protein [candidate division Zixibacteria bacterium]|nr:esterase family protein [candidate division Zixibacteria bacterium]
MKNWHKLFALIFLLFILFAYIGCSDRKNPADTVYPSGNVYCSRINSVFLENNLMWNPSTGRNIFVYVPPGYDEADTSTKYPILYFLHGFMDTTLGYIPTTSDFPYPYGLAQTADRLIATGQIQPMIIAIADCKSKLGQVVPAGSFYVDSPSPIPSNPDTSLNGKFESFYVYEVMDVVEESYHVYKDKSYRAIAGHSMGGYGAFRIAMDYDTLFSIVGSMSGPLSFEYLIDLIPGIFTANGIDSATYRDSLSYKSTDEATRMLFAMAAAFSPHSSGPITSYFIVTPEGTDPYGVDLPFDSTGDTITAVWNRWMTNDIYTIYYATNHIALNSAAIYIDCGDADEFGFNEQSRDFYDALASGPGDRFFEEYSGGGYLPADNSTYLYYRIEKLLKFVSENFPQP